MRNSLALLSALACILSTSQTRSHPCQTAQRSEAVVNAVAFVGPPGPKAYGITSPVRIRINKNLDGLPSVGVIEQYAGATGNQWRTAAWIAAFTASRALNRNMLDYEFIIKVGGKIDGPSAGMLFTATMLALMRGVPLLPHATMTGTVNPDGSAGPVGGIPQKMQGAKARGMRSFGFPVGGRTATDLRTGRKVDLVEFGRKLGLDVREIRDIHDAYFHLTGKTLPRTQPVAEAAMRPDRALVLRLQTKLSAWAKRIKLIAVNVQRRAQKLPPQLTMQLKPLVTTGLQLIQKAAAQEGKQQYASALQTAIRAAVVFRMAHHNIDYLAAYGRQDIGAMLRKIESFAPLDQQLKRLAKKLLRKAERRTVGGLVDVVEGFGYLLRAWAFQAQAKGNAQQAVLLLKGFQSGKIKVTSQTYVTMLSKLMEPLAHYAAVEALIDIAADALKLGEEAGRPAPSAATKLGRLAVAYASAASGGLSYFESLTVEQLAKDNNATLQQARVVVGQKELKYNLIRTAIPIAQYGERAFGKSLGTHALRLAAGAYAYLASASLVNKYYSLRAQTGPKGGGVLQNVGGLVFQIKNGRRRALEAAGACQKELGFIPASAKIAWENARALEGNNYDDMLDALEAYWSATFWSELALALARP